MRRIAMPRAAVPLALLSIAVWTAVPTPVLAATAACDRPCLKSLLNDYLAAVVKHDPAAAPLAPSYRHTENAINVPLGKGVWRSVTALGDVQRRYLDPVSGQAAYY